ncbi:MAG: ribulose-phosphate 3-epimerase [Actinobacteria bacterium]|nr:ribulose-phosphate 3-epimerase [Actinomycetota bacterium]
MLKTKMALSVMLADFWNLKDDILAYEKAKVELIHFDVMDGSFVQNFTLGHDILRSLSKNTKIPIDAHLMVMEPERHIEAFAESGASMCTVHVEVCKHLDRTLRMIRECGMKVGAALNPATSLCTLEYVLGELDMVLIMTVNPGFASQSFISSMVSKIKKLREMFNERNLETDIEVDGCVSLETIPITAGVGANVFVLGTSSIYREGIELVSGIQTIRSCAEESLRKYFMGRGHL